MSNKIKPELTTTQTENSISDSGKPGVGVEEEVYKWELFFAIITIIRKFLKTHYFRFATKIFCVESFTSKTFIRHQTILSTLYHMNATICVITDMTITFNRLNARI